MNNKNKITVETWAKVSSILLKNVNNISKEDKKYIKNAIDVFSKLGNKKGK